MNLLRRINRKGESKMKRLYCFLIPVMFVLILISFLAGCRKKGEDSSSRHRIEQDSLTEIEADEYDVYSCLINKSVSDGELILIHENTQAYSFSEIHKEIEHTPLKGEYLIGYRDEKFGSYYVGSEAKEDYFFKNRYPSQLGYRFHIKSKYLLISRDEFDLFLELRYKENGSFSLFENQFNERFFSYPLELHWFSRVGFNKARTLAFVSWKTGLGVFVGILHKENGEWKLHAETRVIIF